MRITFVIPPPNMSGGMRAIAGYAKRLRDRGHRVVLVYPPPRQPSLKARVASLLRTRRWPEVAKPNPFYLEDLGLKMHRIDRPRPVADRDVPDADVVVATWWETADWVAALSSNKGAKAYFTMDYGAPGQPFDEVRRTWSLPLHLITISCYLRDMIRQHQDVEVSLVPCAVDLEEFQAPPRRQPERPTVGFVYSVSPQKGADICIEAVRLARQEIRELRVLTFGSNPTTEGPELPPGTEFAYQVPDEQLKSIYGACSVWLFGSRREGFGLPILEAMACRTPVIATPAGAAPQLLSEGGGILVKPEDPEEMAQAIVRLCNLSEVDWLAMSNAAYAKARSYTWDDATDLFEEALQAAIDKSRVVGR